MQSFCCGLALLFVIVDFVREMTEKKKSFLYPKKEHEHFSLKNSFENDTNNRNKTIT